MESRKVNKLLPYTEEEKREIWKEYGLKEDIIKSEIEAILEWFDKQPHLVDSGIDVDLIESLFIISKGSREKTKQKIDKLYKVKNTLPEIFDERDKYLKKNFYSWIVIVTMPNLHKLERITIAKVMDPECHNFNFIEYLKTLCMFGEFRLKYDYNLAERWVIDCNNYNWFSLLPKFNPMMFQRVASLFQDGIGIRIKGIHIFNAPSSIQSVINLLKQFIKPKIMERVMIHSTLDEIYQYVGKDHLPIDFGGTQSSIEELAETWRCRLREKETQEYLIECCKKRSDESKRLGEKIVDPLAGSFKKLDLD